MKINRNPMARRQAGMTLIELGIVLAIAAIVIFFAISKFGEISANSRAQNAATEFASIATNIKRIFSTQSNYSTLTATVLANAKAVPLSYVNAGAPPTFQHPLGGALTIGPQNVTGSANDGIRYTYAGVPSPECNMFTQMVVGGAYSITIDGTAVKASPSANLDIAQTATLCAEATNTIVIDVSR
jgi:prepilin-type N-terminal cleavage/methylation domain-containing protein